MSKHGSIITRDDAAVVLENVSTTTSVDDRDATKATAVLANGSTTISVHDTAAGLANYTKTITADGAAAVLETRLVQQPQQYMMPAGLANDSP